MDIIMLGNIRENILNIKGNVEKITNQQFNEIQYLWVWGLWLVVNNNKNKNKKM